MAEGLSFVFYAVTTFEKNFQVLRNSVPTKVTKANLHLFDGVGFSANKILLWVRLKFGTLLVVGVAN